MQASLDLYNRMQNGAVVGVDAVVRWQLSEGHASGSALPTTAAQTEPLAHATLRVPA